KTQATRVYGEANAVRTAIELCILEGRTALGTDRGECDPGYTGSNLVVGARQVGGTLPTGLGVPQMLDPLVNSGNLITSTFGNKASLVLAGSQIILHRSQEGDWTCQVVGSGFTGTNEKYIPGSCQ
ncbi:MAG: pilin, partial [Zoogloeaceae bacterium]|nr:pilin [Zoogloeaceae bacterium]